MKKLILILSLLYSAISWGQSDSISTPIDTSKYVTFSRPSEQKLDLTTKKKAPTEFKKKKPKKKVFYGYKTRKGLTFKNKGVHQVLEVFFYLKKWDDPNTFVKDIYWFDPVKQKIIKSHKYDPLTSKLLHGPYIKKFDSEIVERGVFYKGVKHARWEKWSSTKPLKLKRLEYTDEDTTEVIVEIPQNQLLEKKKYNRGWPKNAEISYYDGAKKKYKEIIPYNEANDLHGEYFRYYENGKLAEYGKYSYGYKIGKWITYHDSKGKYHFKDQILAYPKKGFYTSDKKPFLIGSWNSKGTQLENNTKEYNDLIKKQIQEKKKH